MTAPGSPRYVREPPGVHPAIAAVVAGTDASPDAAVVASLLSLVERGLATIGRSSRTVTSIFGATERQTYEFVIDVARWNEYGPIDQSLVALLFTEMKRSAAMGLEDLRALLRSHENVYVRGIARWRQETVERAIADGWLESDGHTLTVAGEELRDRCLALRAYLRDFGRLEDELPEGLTMWGPYLVWASLFGLADEVLAALRLRPANAHDDLALALETLTD